MRSGGAFAFLDGGGAMGSAVRKFDWASTSLGPIEEWSAALRVAVSMVLNSSFPKCIFWGADFINIYNDAYRPILGDKPEPLGRPFREVWSEAWDTLGPIAQTAFAGEATFIEDFAVTIERRGYSEEAFFTFCYSPIRDERGEIVGIMATVVETTAKARAERKLQLINAELAHRMKNLLTMVSGLVGQTLEFAPSSGEAKRTVAQRLSALGRAHSMLMEESQNGALIGSIIEAALAPFRQGRGRISLEGAPLVISARQALSLALAFHELATNSTKYGALSCPTGRVTISWKVGLPGTEQEFSISWAEAGGPLVQEPQRKGFGSRLIEEVLAADFRGTVQLVYRPEGVRCDLITTMKELDPVEAQWLSTALPSLQGR
ncbi:PAS domain-containing sensor histidine kinase [Chelativorans sp. Marseille-P2723]|uniref:sensor histidine kinase n=1 Tax=Chelativorans sp. Marseille-P2723 TaxID=2709133 RepID=UPI00156F2763|nr:PAS domain-containing sensor histidine kinase [Chelativorans sp. Marseille-P2723]